MAASLRVVGALRVYQPVWLHALGDLLDSRSRPGPRLEFGIHRCRARRPGCPAGDGAGVAVPGHRRRPAPVAAAGRQSSGPAGVDTSGRAGPAVPVPLPGGGLLGGGRRGSGRHVRSRRLPAAGAGARSGGVAAGPAGPTRPHRRAGAGVHRRRAGRRRGPARRCQHHGTGPAAVGDAVPDRGHPAATAVVDAPSQFDTAQVDTVDADPRHPGRLRCGVLHRLHRRRRRLWHLRRPPSSGPPRHGRSWPASEATGCTTSSPPAMVRREPAPCST